MNETRTNEVPEFHCSSCEDYGYIEIFHPSTDGLIGHRKCPRLHGMVYKRHVEVKFPSVVTDVPPF